MFSAALFFMWYNFKFLSPRFITHLDIHLKHIWDLAWLQPPSESIEFWQIKWSVTKITYLKFSSFRDITISIYFLVPSSLVLISRQKMSTRTLARVTFSFSKHHRRRDVTFPRNALCYYRDSDLFTSLLDRKTTLQWGNLQEVRKTGLHGSNINFVRFEIGSVYSITAGLQWKFLSFDGVLQRFPLITHANSRVF